MVNAIATEPKKETFIRTTSILIDAGQVKDQLDATIKIVHDRAKEFCMAILAMLGKEVRIYDPSTKKTEIKDAAFWENYRKANLTRYQPKYKELLEELCRSMLGSAQPRGFLSPMRCAGAKAGSSDKTMMMCRELLDLEVLPFKFNTEIPSTLDYAAWESATSYMSSWIVLNETTEKAYQDAEKKVVSLTPPEDKLAMLGKLKAETGLFINGKLLYKLEKYGFDVTYAKADLEVAQRIEPNVLIWRKLFEYEMAKNRLEELSPSSRVRLIDADSHLRMISFGHNYTKFSLSFVDGQFVIDTKLYNDENEDMENVRLTANGSNYFRNLTIEEARNSQRENSSCYYKMSYDRGNNSKLTEHVNAELREIKLLARGKGGDKKFYFYLPFKVESATNALGRKIKDNYKSEPKKTPMDIPDGTRILSCDMGINPFWAVQCFEWIDGTKKSVYTKSIGVVKDQDYYNSVKSLLGNTYDLSKSIDYLKSMESGKTEFWSRQEEKFRKGCEFLGLEYPCNVGELRQKVKDSLRELNNRYKQLKRFDLHGSRQTGVSQEQFHWIVLTKRMISLKKKWTYYMSPPVDRFEIRPGFEKLSRYFKNLKSEMVKKFAQCLVYEARQSGSSVIVKEDLDFERSVAKISSADNEFMSLWSPAMINKWLSHFCEQYGIELIEVEASDTSKRDPDSGDWLFRSKENKQEAWADRGGKLVKLHADLEVATGNIMNRLIHRSAEVCKMQAKYVINAREAGVKKCYVPMLAKKVVQKDEEEPTGSKSKKWKANLLSHHLKLLYGTDSLVIDAETNKVVKVSKSVMNSLITEGKAVTLYRHKKKWLDKDDHRKTVESIAARLRESDSS